MKKRSLFISAISSGILMLIMFAAIDNLKIALVVNSSIAAGLVFNYLRYRWEMRRNSNWQRREEHKRRFNFRPGSRHFDTLNR